MANGDKAPHNAPCATVVRLSEKVEALLSREKQVEADVDELRKSVNKVDRTVAVMEALFRENLEVMKKFAGSIEKLDKTVTTMDSTIALLQRSVETIATTAKIKTDSAEKKIKELEDDLKELQEIGEINWMLLLKKSFGNIISIVTFLVLVLVVILNVFGVLDIKIGG